MPKKLFLLDGMALAYRAHFALIRRPIFTSKGVNSSALFGFTQTLLEILTEQSPTHIAVAFDTDAPTQRHRDFPDYKIQREAMPEDLSQALPHVRRMIEAFNIPVIALDGYEADDVIGTLVRRAEQEDFESYMVTPDKDFGQLVTPKTFLYKPSRQGDGIEILGVAEILGKWGIKETRQVIDILGLWGDATDNIPGVPGIGEKTAGKLISEYGSVENLLAHTAELKGKLKESLEANRDQALLSKRLATIDCAVPLAIDLDALQRREWDAARLKSLFVEFEFNSIGRRLLGDEFKAGRGFAGESQTKAGGIPPKLVDVGETGDLFTLTSALSRGERGRESLSPRSGKARATRFAPTQDQSSPPHEPDSTRDYTDKTASPSAKSVVNKSVQGSNVRSVSENPLPEGEGQGEGEGSGPVHEAEAQRPAPSASNLKTIADVPHEYQLIRTREERAKLIQTLGNQPSFCFSAETTSFDPKEAQWIGIAFSFAPRSGYFVLVPQDEIEARAILEEFRALFESDRIEKVGHNLKFELSLLQWRGVTARGKLFDTMLAHSLIEPDMRHALDYLAEVYLGYSPVPVTKLIGEGILRPTSPIEPLNGPLSPSEGERVSVGRERGPFRGREAEQLSLSHVPLDQLTDYATEGADIAWQLRAVLAPLLREKGQERVFYEIESPLLPVLVAMECEGVRLDAAVLGEFADQLSKEINAGEKAIYRLARTEFNLNSPKQLGEILFDGLKIAAKPKKTRTGQYATDEQTLLALAGEHEIVPRILEYRAMTKLKSTYADTLPTAIFPKTGRVHTTYQQAATATGRLQSQNPNLQNIPIRTELGQEIRKAFVPRDENHLLLSADYSQIELRIIAALSRDTAMIEAFRSGHDIHTATAAKVYGVPLDQVNAEMRRKAKMVNFGIIYGISAFGLAQRLGIARQEAAAIIEQYFHQFPGIRKYMSDTIAFAREQGFVQTVAGRRRYLRDVRSSNATVRGGAERNAINAPIQGSAADMIKIAMVQIHRELTRRGLTTRMLLQVHDELIFDLFKPEEQQVRALIEEGMGTAIPLEVPIAVEIGLGKNWLEAH
ncbi:MAG: DNA polymerase I [Verrucomicrobia bacterium]|nr:DNA polymerase I [Verrucomicrobiota bacterium]